MERVEKDLNSPVPVWEAYQAIVNKAERREVNINYVCLINLCLF